VLEKRFLRRIFECKRDEATGKWRKLHSLELCNLYSLPDNIRQISSRKRGGQDMWHAWERRRKCKRFWW
jgi:hypothetical protein